MAKKPTKTTSSASSSKKSSARRKPSGSSMYIAIVVGVVLIGMVFAVGYSLISAKDTTGKLGAVPRNTTDKYSMAVGNPDAKAKVVIYEDFQCPYCDEFENAARDQLTQAAADGKAYILYTPIAFLDRSSTTNYSTRALNAFGVVLDSAGVQVADKFHNLLYENQPAEGSAGLTDDQLINYAVQAGADKVTVSNPIRSQAFLQWTVNATNAASLANITGTPTIMVNGVQVQGQTMADLVTQTMAAISAAQ